MGGNATKHVGTTRKDRTEYFRIAEFVTSTLRDLFPSRRIKVIQAYFLKESFGDIDILIESNDLPANWHEILKNKFMPKAFINNGGVLSFDAMGMQIDLISTPVDEFDFAASYFSYNDLGNLMGRIAHKMGFKYGHDGFWKPMRKGTHQYAEILVSRDIEKVLTFLGYNYVDYICGFHTLEAVFKFAASTPYFHRDIFALDNRNHISRVRDAKRPSYTAFLKWVEDKPELDKYTWSAYTGDAPSQERFDERDYWLSQAFKFFPELLPNVMHADERHAKREAFKKVWNGEIVGTTVGMTEGKELGQFMAYCKKYYAELYVPSPKANVTYAFEDYVLTLPSGALQQYILARKAAWDLYEKRT
jgi:hypothetical protein